MAGGTKSLKKRVVSGMRPTGRLHIGHYFGALENWVRLQADPEYQCFYFIADWHALTSDYADTSGVAQNTIEIMTDYLAAGLDPGEGPGKSVIFQQSLVPEHAELHLLLSMVTPLGWLERVPTYKEALENVKDKDLHNYGFLGYPVLQCADITIYSSPEIAGLFVPVGEDQVSHVETSREIVRRFNLNFGEVVEIEKLIAPGLRDTAIELFTMLFPAEPRPSAITLPTAKKMAASMTLLLAKSRAAGHVEMIPNQHAYFSNFVVRTLLVEPHAMLTKTPRIPGLDGRKMSKSYGNAIMLSESDEDIRKRTKVMVTDPARKRRTDPGDPDVCPVYDWHKLFSTGEPGRLEWVRQGCTTAGIGCIECKSAMADNLIKWIAPVRDRRVEHEKHPARVVELIQEGSKRARVEAAKTMERVREAVFGWGNKKAQVAGL